MASSYGSRANSMVDDYLNLRELPGYISAGYLVASLYQYGGLDAFSLTWFNFTLGQQVAVWIGIGALLVAFASSKTKRFENYELWEQGVMGANVVAMAGWHYIPAVKDFIVSLGDPLGAQAAFLLSVVAWAVIIR